jgi:Mlc titration factor MtfA (ptsG expression regulator)/Tfp pilus assembly protein PilF
MFGWWKQRRRRILLAEPFAPAWEACLVANVRHYGFLRPPEQEKLRAKAAILVAEKAWTECGQKIDEEVKVTLAGQAAVLLLGLDNDYCFDRLRSVFVYPGGRGHPLYLERWQLPAGARHSGEAWPRGPLTLAWSHALAGARGAPDGRNLVLHELAHHLDELDGELDGIPPFSAADDRRHWVRQYQRLARHAEPHGVRLLGEYHVPDEMDFFAVATECFFQRPAALRRQHAEIYELLQRFYQQDPAAVWPDAVADAPDAARDRRVEQEALYEASVEQCVRQMRLPADSGDACFTEGVIHMQHGRPDKAAPCYDRAVALTPDDAEVRWHRAACRLELGQAAEALPDCDAAIGLDPTDVEAYRVRGRVYRALREFDRSIADLSVVVANTENDADAHYQRGLSEADAGRYPEAVADYGRAICHAPTRVEYYVARCQAYHALGLWEQADADRREALRRDPRLEDDDPA